MAILAVPATGSLRQRLVDEIPLRRFSRETQRNYIRDVGRLATFLRRFQPPDEVRHHTAAESEATL